MSAPEVASIHLRTRKPIQFGLAGLGGYAGVICDQLLRSMQQADSPVMLSHVCEPNLGMHAERVAQLRNADVEIFDNYDDLLATDAEAVWLPLPIDLHRPFTERALAAGKAVMCEKPAAGCVDDVDAMIAARDAAGLPVGIGFQLLYDPQIRELKRRIIAGVIGRPMSASVQVCWPRDERYYQRNSWAGAMKHNGVWVLDSPANNAMAHYITLALFLLGPEEQLAAVPVSVESELYRVNPIENYDTCSLRYELTNKARLLVLMTHASQEEAGPTITITGERGTIRFNGMQQIEIPGEPRAWPIGSLEQLHANMHTSFAACICNEDERQTIATLEMARAHTVAVNGASEAAVVETIDPKFVEVRAVGDGKVLRYLPEIPRIFARCAREMKMLHESELVPWSNYGRVKELRKYTHFGGPRG